MIEITNISKEAKRLHVQGFMRLLEPSCSLVVENYPYALDPESFTVKDLSKGTAEVLKSLKTKRGSNRDK